MLEAKFLRAVVFEVVRIEERGLLVPNHRRIRTKAHMPFGEMLVRFVNALLASGVWSQ